MTTIPTEAEPAHGAPTLAPSSLDAKQTGPIPAAPVADALPKWLKVLVLIVPVFAFLISSLSLGVSIMSLRFSMGYTRQYEDHDVVAKVLGVSVFPKHFSSITTNGELSVDVALINRGNQKEIIREVFLCYSDTNDFRVRGSSWEGNNPEMNIQLDRAERRVVHISTPFNSGNTGKRMWLGVAARAVAPNADDIEVVWPVSEINLAPDGNGGWFSYDKDKTPRIQLISNERQPHQRLAPDGL